MPTSTSASSSGCSSSPGRRAWNGSTPSRPTRPTWGTTPSRWRPTWNSTSRGATSTARWCRAGGAGGDDVGTGEYAGYRSHDFRLTGEVIKDDKLFESFRYQFGFPDRHRARQLAPGLPALPASRRIPRDPQGRRPALEESLASRIDDPGADVGRRVRGGVVYRSGDRRTVPRGGRGGGRRRGRHPHRAAAGRPAHRLRALRHAGGRREHLQGALLPRRQGSADQEPAALQRQIDLGPFPDLHTLRAEGSTPRAT